MYVGGACGIYIKLIIDNPVGFVYIASLGIYNFNIILISVIIHLNSTKLNHTTIIMYN